MAKKKRNPNDATLRNVRAANKKLDRLFLMVRQIKKKLSKG